MTSPETFTTALQNLATHKLRTALTMLGMIFGVGAVIAMLSIGAGGEKKALEAIGRLGLRNVIVRAKTVKPDERAELRKKSLGVSLRDGEAINEAVPRVEMVL
ncbi:MAG TPA: ABC transporter permease, partial [Thermoanaerobaculia bacterium]|nr:ABC transporter permease [Thermoanaerobaculia bacterium]